jgi:hypothetical protein
VRVFNPDYARSASAGAVGPSDDPRAPAPLTDLDDAWSAARRRAAYDLNAGRVRPAYRPIVRAFFETTRSEHE